MISMFANATFKLTLIYMGILTLICLFFSYNWYTIATDELERSYKRQRNSLNTLQQRPRAVQNLDRNEIGDDAFLNELLTEAEERFTEAEDAILGRVIATNIIIISAGGLGSYFLARRTLDPIERAHQEQIRFTADASHELRTPLTAMRSEIEVALRDKKLSKSEAIDLLHSSIEELAKLSSLSEGLLKLARQDESVGISIKEVSLEAILSAAIDRVSKAAKHKEITISHTVDESHVMADFDGVTEMLVILLDNAIKYSPRQTTVAVSTAKTKGYVHVHVSDSGNGVRETDQTRIFERFYRADHSRSSQNETGHGLGLSIAKNISDIHDAKLRVESDGAGSGSTFSFRLKRVS